MAKIFKFINKWTLTIIGGLCLLALIFFTVAILLAQLDPLIPKILISIGCSITLLEILVLLLFIFNIENQSNKEENINEKTNN